MYAAMFKVTLMHEDKNGTSLLMAMPVVAQKYLMEILYDDGKAAVAMNHCEPEGLLMMMMCVSR